MRGWGGARGWAGVTMVVAVAGCAESSTPGDRADGGVDGACVPSETFSFIGTPRARVDLLFVVDNSSSTLHLQLALARAFPSLARGLATGDAEGDGIGDFDPVEDLHVGVVSVDMGSGEFDLGAVCRAGLGDDGIFQVSGDPSVTGCTPPYPTFLSLADGDAAGLAADFGCVAVLGDDGCGFEHPLEAALKALTPSTSDLVFARGTAGHGDGVHAGFLEEDSVLGIVVVMDEDDCSVRDPELFNPESTFYETSVLERCLREPEALHLISRYVDGFLALRSRPRRLLFAALAGVPPDLAADPRRPDYDLILSDPRMAVRFDPPSTSFQVESCLYDGDGDGVVGSRAFPPRRIVEVAQRLSLAHAYGMVASACTSDFTPALDAITRQLGAMLSDDCIVARPSLELGDDGRVGCGVEEILAIGSCAPRCATGRRPYGCPFPEEGGPPDPCDCPPETAVLDPETGREVCKLDQIPRSELVTSDEGTCAAPDGARGWFYDDCSGTARALCAEGDAFRIGGTSLTPGAVARIRCPLPTPACR